MKNFLLLLLLSAVCFFPSSSYAQLELIKNNLNHPTAIAFHGDKIYATLHGNSPNNGGIASFDINDPEGTFVIHLDSLAKYPRSLAIKDDALYIGFTSYIGKVDLTQPEFVLEEYINNVFFPRSLEFVGDRLYIAEDDKITYADVSNSSPFTVEVIGNVIPSPLSITVKGDELYTTSGNGIYKVSLTDSSPTLHPVRTDFDNKIYAICAVDNELYLDQTFNSATGKKIVKFNLLEPGNTLETVVDIPGSAIHIIYEEEHIYFSGRGPTIGGTVGQIFKIAEEIIANTEDLKSSSVSIYPNPTRDVIQLVGVPVTNYVVSLFNSLGQLVLQLGNQNTIDLSSLPAGSYYLRIDTEEGLRSASQTVIVTK
ncbi:MAG: T9SS type A sorting domain-containing protein [Bacteroidota bacterium]